MANAQVNEKNCENGRTNSTTNGIKNAFEFFTGIELQMEYEKGYWKRIRLGRKEDGEENEKIAQGN